MKQAFDAYSAYYDLVYQDKNYQAEVNYVDDLLTQHGTDVSKLLEFGSGTGVHGNLLAECGYQVTGIELSAQMVDQAVISEHFNCLQGDIRNVRLNKIFDAVISLFHVMSYQISNKDIVAAMESAALHLPVGGLFIFDFWYTAAVYAQKPTVRVKRMKNESAQITRVAEPRLYPNDNRVDVHYAIDIHDVISGQYREIEEVHSMRHFSLPEIDLLAQITGFERLAAQEFVTGNNPSEDTWGVCVVLRKKK